MKWFRSMGLPAMVFGLVATALSLVQSPASAAGYIVTATPQTWAFTYQYRTTNGYAGTWVATDTLAGTANACNPANPNTHGTWANTQDLSTYHFNDVSAAGVQRRGCSFTTVGPNAVNANCVPADCQIKVVFSGGVAYTDWANMTSGQYNYAGATMLIATDCPNTTYFQNCSAPFPTQHPDQAITTTMASCPASSNDMVYTCSAIPDAPAAPATPGSSAAAAPGSSPLSTLTVSKHGHRLHVRTTAPVAAEKLVVQRRTAARWHKVASKTFTDAPINWSKRLTAGRYRVVLTPGSTSAKLVKHLRIR